MLPTFDFWTVYRVWTERLAFTDETSVTVRRVNNTSTVIVLGWRMTIHGKPRAGEHRLDPVELNRDRDLPECILSLANKVAKEIMGETKDEQIRAAAKCWAAGQYESPLIPYSSTIDLYLDAGPHGIVPLSQAADTFVIVTTAVRLPPCRARIVLVINGERFDREVDLVRGMEGREGKVRSVDPPIP